MPNRANAAPKQEDFIGLFFGLGIAALGIMVMTGWLLHLPTLVHVIAGNLNMRFNSALCFFLVGALFIIYRSGEGALQNGLIFFLSCVLLFLPMAVLIEHLYDVDLYIDWIELHKTIPDTNPHPGRISPVTCASMMLAGLSFMILLRARLRDEKPSLVTVPASLIFIIGVSSLMNQLLHLHEVYAFARHNVMAMHTAIGLCVVGIGLWAISRFSMAARLTRSERALREDNQRLGQVVKAQLLIAQSEFDLDHVLKTIVEQLMQITGASGAAVELVDNEDLLYRATAGKLKAFNKFRLPVKNSLSGVCIDSNKVINCPDTERDIRVNRSATRQLNIRSMIVAPLSHNNKVVGVLKASADQKNAFTEYEAEAIALISGLIGAAIARQQDVDAKNAAIVSLKEAQAKLTHMAEYDQLTGLPNRALFMDRISGALARMSRSKQALALMYLDLDGFKGVNDTMGHAAGDELLKQFGERVKKNLRTSDTVARLGGDEFTIIAESLVNPDADVEIVARKIILAMTEPFIIMDKPVHVTTSIGICLVKDPAAKMDEVIVLADTEMYKAKKSGKNRFRIIVR
jgi:diguanylate cyclase (GGDEF)-like protein